MLLFNPVLMPAPFETADADEFAAHREPRGEIRRRSQEHLADPPRAGTLAAPDLDPCTGARTPRSRSPPSRPSSTEMAKSKGNRCRTGQMPEVSRMAFSVAARYTETLEEADQFLVSAGYILPAEKRKRPEVGANV